MTMRIRNIDAASLDVPTQSGLAAQLLVWFQRLFRTGLGKAGCERRLKLVETLHLGGKRQLMLVLCDGHPLLLGAGGDSIQSIVEIRHQPVASTAPVRLSEGLPEYEQADAIEGPRQETVCQ